MTSIPHSRLDKLLKRFELIEAQMAAGPDSATYVKLASEYSELEETALKVRELRAARAEHADLEALLADPGTDAEMAALAEEELPAVAERLEALENEIRILMLPRDTADSRNVILESEPEPAVTRRRSLPAICSGCMSAMLRRTAGRSR